MGREPPGGVHLDRGEARLDLRAAASSDLGGFVAADPGVHPDPVPDRPAEQGVHRYADGLPGDVPQRLVEAGDGAGEHGPAR